MNHATSLQFFALSSCFLPLASDLTKSPFLDDIKTHFLLLFSLTLICWHFSSPHSNQYLIHKACCCPRVFWWIPTVVDYLDHVLWGQQWKRPEKGRTRWMQSTDWLGLITHDWDRKNTWPRHGNKECATRCSILCTKFFVLSRFVNYWLSCQVLSIRYIPQQLSCVDRLWIISLFWQILPVKLLVGLLMIVVHYPLLLVT